MGYAVYHTEKGTISSGGIGKHIDRDEGAEHTYRHADPTKKNLNQSFVITEYCKKPLHQAISERIAEGYNARNKAGNLKEIRKDCVKYSTHILTGTHEDMKRIESDPKEMNRWLSVNLQFVSEEFGKENIVRFVLHRDEKTPHLHVVTVNLTKDGRLSAKEILGNRKEMQERQDRYAELMKPFGLERGIKNTGIEHEDAKTYYARMKESLEVTKEEKINVKKGIFSVDFSRTNEKTIERLSVENKGLKTALKSKELEIVNLQKKNKDSFSRFSHFSDKNFELKKIIAEKQIEFKNLLFDKKKQEELKASIILETKDRIKKELDRWDDFSFSTFDSLMRNEMKKINPNMHYANVLDNFFERNFEDNMFKYVMSSIEEKQKLKQERAALQEIKKQKEEEKLREIETREENEEPRKKFRR